MAIGATHPAGQIAEVEDVARAYVYCMEQTHGTGTGTGIVLVVDGGSLLV
jgi:hypothetical protein